MQALVIDAFAAAPVVREVPDPTPDSAGAVLRVQATGLCRSDWHAWAGHDPTITLPHVPGHEMAGEIVAVGSAVTRWRIGDRVTVPFVCACGTCPSCARGDHQVCHRQQQPGFDHWGSYAEYVALTQADVNLVALPDGMEAATAASLGCRFATAYRAVVHQGRVRPGDWVAVHGCGGVGLSAVLVAVAAGARVVAVDISGPALELASRLGAEHVVNASESDAARAVRDATGGGAMVSLDSLGSAATAEASVRSLRRRGRHIQVGLLPPGLPQPALAMSRVIAHELEILGSHGMAAHDYPPMLGLVAAGRLRPDLLVTSVIDLHEAVRALPAMSSVTTTAGVTVIRPGQVQGA